jgi:hypothetical protein
VRLNDGHLDDYFFVVYRGGCGCWRGTRRISIALSTASAFCAAIFEVQEYAEILLFHIVWSVEINSSILALKRSPSNCDPVRFRNGRLWSNHCRLLKLDRVRMHASSLRTLLATEPSDALIDTLTITK